MESGSKKKKPNRAKRQENPTSNWTKSANHSRLAFSPPKIDTNSCRFNLFSSVNRHYHSLEKNPCSAPEPEFCRLQSPCKHPGSKSKLFPHGVNAGFVRSGCCVCSGPWLFFFLDVTSCWEKSDSRQHISTHHTLLSTRTVTGLTKVHLTCTSNVQASSRKKWKPEFNATLPDLPASLTCLIAGLTEPDRIASPASNVFVPSTDCPVNLTAVAVAVAFALAFGFARLPCSFSLLSIRLFAFVSLHLLHLALHFANRNLVQCSSPCLEPPV